MQPSIQQVYPQIAHWVTTQGWIEVGYDEVSRSFVRALDIGGMVWEGAPSYPSLEDALRALDIALGGSIVFGTLPNWSVQTRVAR